MLIKIVFIVQSFSNLDETFGLFMNSVWILTVCVCVSLVFTVLPVKMRMYWCAISSHIYAICMCAFTYAPTHKARDFRKCSLYATIWICSCTVDFNISLQLKRQLKRRAWSTISKKTTPREQRKNGWKEV